MAMSREKFVEHLIKRRLMTESEVRAFEKRLPTEKLRDDDAAPFMQELIDQQKITAGDALSIYHRREGGLFGRPDKVRIVPDRFFSDHVGRLNDGTQFIAFCTGALPDGYVGGPKDDDWETTVRVIAVLHQFDADGNHLGSESRLGAFRNEEWDRANEKAEVQLQALLAPLQKRHPQQCDVWVKLFSVVLDGVTHGLRYESYADEDGEGEWVALLPGDLAFEAPWNTGENST
jgi:hypothetical protein